MQPKERDAAYLWDMQEALRTIREFVAGKTLHDFRSEQILRDAVIRQLTVLGEAAGRISPVTRDQNPQIPWKRIVGLRNVVVHQYDKIKAEKIWLVVEADVAALLQQIEPLVPPLPEIGEG